jgi:hypothetical protein
MRFLVRTFAAFAWFNLIANTAMAQDANLIDQATDATCTSFLAPVLGRKDIAIIATARSIKSEDVCGCAKARTREDSRLTAYYALDNDSLAQKTNDAKIRSYIIGRVLQSVLACFGNELGTSLDAYREFK